MVLTAEALVGKMSDLNVICVVELNEIVYFLDIYNKLTNICEYYRCIEIWDYLWVTDDISCVSIEVERAIQ